MWRYPRNPWFKDFIRGQRVEKYYQNSHFPQYQPHFAEDDKIIGENFEKITKEAREYLDHLVKNYSLGTLRISDLEILNGPDIEPTAEQLLKAIEYTKEQYIRWSDRYLTIERYSVDSEMYLITRTGLMGSDYKKIIDDDLLPVDWYLPITCHETLKDDKFFKAQQFFHLNTIFKDKEGKFQFKLTKVDTVDFSKVLILELIVLEKLWNKPRDCSLKKSLDALFENGSYRVLYDNKNWGPGAVYKDKMEMFKCIIKKSLIVENLGNKYPHQYAFYRNLACLVVNRVSCSWCHSPNHLDSECEEANCEQCVGH